jgi:hypothetical protein
MREPHLTRTSSSRCAHCRTPVQCMHPTTPQLAQAATLVLALTRLTPPNPLPIDCAPHLPLTCTRPPLVRPAPPRPRRAAPSPCRRPAGASAARRDGGAHARPKDGAHGQQEVHGLAQPRARRLVIDLEALGEGLACLAELLVRVRVRARARVGLGLGLELRSARCM